ncbi:MAG: hypothetical protein Q7S22_02285 [Candidatus Micrarchaeota archaeon]|nr:hypothetical protein [Candidatus Micrarchaeota archaeon]
MQVPDNLLGNCYQFVDKAICDTTGNLSVSQKKNLILNGLNPNVSYPNYDFIDSWNTKTVFTKYAPNDANISSSGAIRDAWVKILYINPSVYLDNNTLVNGTGKIYSEANFSFVVPYRTFSQDCQTNYVIKGYDYALDLDNNGNKINSENGKMANFSLTETNNTFEARLSIQSEYDIQHFRWQQRCSTNSKGTAVCYSICELYSTDVLIDRLSINDTEEAYLYNLTNDAKYIVDGENNNLLDYWFSTNTSNDLASMLFRSGNSSISIKGVDYKLRYEHEPYNTLSYEAIRKETTVLPYGVSILADNESENNSIIYRKFHAIFPSNNCSLTFQSHFDTFVRPDFCDISNETPVLNISLSNRTNESVEVEITFFENHTNAALESKEIDIAYGNLHQTAITDTDGKVKVTFPFAKENSIITAKFTTDLETKSAETLFVILPETPDIASWILSGASTGLTTLVFYKISKGLFYAV